MRWSPHRVEPSNESEVTGSENEVPNPLKSCAVITSVAYEQPVIATKDERVGVSTTVNIKIVLCRMHNANRALLISRHDATICRWYVLPRSISEAGGLVCCRHPSQTVLCPSYVARSISEYRIQSRIWLPTT
jgi:hypothetical protein